MLAASRVGKKIRRPVPGDGTLLLCSEKERERGSSSRSISRREEEEDECGAGEKE